MNACKTLYFDSSDFLKLHWKSRSAAVKLRRQSQVLVSSECLHTQLLATGYLVSSEMVR